MQQLIILANAFQNVLFVLASSVCSQTYVDKNTAIYYINLGLLLHALGKPKIQFQTMGFSKL